MDLRDYSFKEPPAWKADSETPAHSLVNSLKR